MKLVAQDSAEYRMTRKYTSSSGNVSFFYTFESDDVGSFELWSKELFTLEKGKQYTLVFDMTFYQGEKRINLVEVKPLGK